MDDLISDDDDILDGLGLKEKSSETSRSSRSALMDNLLGKSSPPPLEFNKTETSKAGKLLASKAGPAKLKMDDLISDDDDILDGLGLKEKPSETSRSSRSALMDNLLGKSSPPPLKFNKTETSQAEKLSTGKTGPAKLKIDDLISYDDDILDGLGLKEKPSETSRSYRSALMDNLLGKSSPPPLEFNKTETSKAGKLLASKAESANTDKEVDDILFGSYMPSFSAPSASNTPSSKPDGKDEKSNRRSGTTSTRQRKIVSPKNSFDDDDDDDDTLDWLKISSNPGSKSSEKSETSKVPDGKEDGDYNDDDWFGTKSKKKSVSFNLEEGLDLDPAPAVSFNPGQIKGGSRTEDEIKPSTSAAPPAVENPKPQPQLPVVKKALEQNSSKSGITNTKETNPKKEVPKETPLGKKPELVTLPDTHKKEISPLNDEETALLQQLESVNLMPSLGSQLVPNLRPRHHYLSNSSDSAKSHMNFSPFSADTNMSSSSFEKLTDAEIKINRLHIEKEQLQILIESMKKRSSEEIEAIEHSYKSRLQLLEETHEHKEKSWRDENEHVLKQHFEKMQRLELEKSEMTARHYNILQSSFDEHSAEVQRLKESHQTAMELQRREFEEALDRMKEIKQREVDNVENLQSTSKSLHLVMEQIHSNSKDLNSFQQKLDEWQLKGLDEREMSIRARDQQLKILQDRLNRQQEENSLERTRLEDLICRLEGQLKSQTQMLDDERWKMKQEANKYYVLQSSVEAEKKQWVEQQAREKTTMERSRNALMDEQRQLMTQLFEERRALAEEKVHMEVSRKLWAEREQHNSIKSMKIDTEFDATMKALEEERNKSNAQLEHIETEKMALLEDRKKFEKEKKNFEDKKTELAEMASQMKTRSKEIEFLFDDAQKRKEDGEILLAKSNKMDMEYSQRWRALMNQTDHLAEQEKQLAAETITLAQERDRLENLRKSHLCLNCRNSISGATGSINGKVAPKMSATFNSTQTGTTYWGGYRPEAVPIQATEESAPVIHDTLNAIRIDQWLKQLKKQSLKDKEFLLREKVYLATLENGQYQFA